MGRSDGIIQFSALLNSGWRLYQMYDGIRTVSRRSAQEAQAEHARQLLLAGHVSGKLQNAALGTLTDAIRAGLLEAGGLPFGFFDGHPLYHNSDKPLLCYGPTGTGKGRDILSGAVADNITNSFVIIDPKGSFALMTEPWRQQVGPCFFANPWRLAGLGNDNLNPLQPLIDQAAAGVSIIDAAKEVTSILFPSPEKHQGNAWIQMSADELVHMLLVDLAERQPEHCHFGSLWNILHYPLDQFGEWMSMMERSDAGAGFVAAKVAKFTSTYKKDSDQLGWVRDAASQAVRLYYPGGVLRDAVASTDFDIRTLKHTPSTLYLMIDGASLDSHGSWLSLQINAIIETLARTPGPVRVTFLLDELPSLPVMPATLKALRLYREQGIQLWCFSQDRKGLEKHGGYQVFEEQAGMHQMWSVGDAQLAKELQEWAGYRAELVPGLSASRSVQADGTTDSGGEVLTPVLPVSDIAQINEGKQIIRIKGYPLFVADRVPWYRVSPWKSRLRNIYAEAAEKER